MKPLAIALAGLLLLIQYPLWLGKGGWLRVWELDRQLAAQKGTNKRLEARNASLDGEVRDLRQGLFAVEERARYELGMVRPDEIFVQINETTARHAPRPATPEAPIRPAQAPAQLQAALPAAARREGR